MASPASEPAFGLSPSFGGEEHDPEFHSLEVQVQRFGQRYRGQVSQLSPAELAVALQELAQFTQGLRGIWAAASPTDETERGRGLEQAITLQNELLFFPLELQALPTVIATRRFREPVSGPEAESAVHDPQGQRLDGAPHRWRERLADDRAEPELRPFHLFLCRLLHQRGHQQPEPLERLVNQQHLTGRLAWRQLWQLALRLSERHSLIIAEQERAYTLAHFQSLQTHPSAEIRLAAYQRLCQHLEAHADLCGFILSTLVRDQLWEAQWRGYDSAAELYLARHSLTQAPFENLMEGIRDRFDLFQRYYRLKSREMGRSIRICDLQAPWGDPVPPLTPTEASSLIWAALQDFCPECATQAKPWLSEGGDEQGERERGEQDSPEAVGEPLLKTLAAVSRRLRPEDPLVWLDLEDLQADPQPSVLVQVHTAFLQLLVLDHLLGSHRGLNPVRGGAGGPEAFRASHDAEGQRSSSQKLALAQTLLIHYLEAQLQAVFCQSLISRLELLLYRPGIPELEKAVRGSGPEALTYPLWVSEEWLKLYQELCGDAVELLPEHQFHWVGIPELFLRPFSAHQASLASLVALACYRRYHASPRDLLPRYLNWLASPPGSLTLEESAQMLQVDLADPDVVLQALEELEHWIETLEELLEEGPNHR
jgi:oligoendopeptidase F